MYQHLPNALTILRLVLAGVFFVVLNQYRYPDGDDWVLWVSLGLFVTAAITDVLDGYLARKWKVETTFGRIMDPFCDKVLVLGAFIYLAGPRFVDPSQPSAFFNMVSGVYPWMIALILARELLVTGIRDEMESRGVRFGARISGKLKTLLQVIVIPFLLGIAALDPRQPGREWMAWVRDILVYATVIVTAVSGIPYVTSAIRGLRQHRSDPS